MLVPAVGDPNQLLVQDLPQTGPFKENVGQQVVTAGFEPARLQSLYPPGIPIGTRDATSTPSELSSTSRSTSTRSRTCATSTSSRS